VGQSRSSAKAALLRMLVRWVSVAFWSGVHMCLDRSVSASSHMEPSKKGFHVEEEEEGRECIVLDGASFNWCFLSASPGG